VVKGDKYTDDLFRAAVLGVSRINDPKIAEELTKYALREGRINSRLGMISAGRSSMMNPQLPHYLTSAGQQQQRMLAISSNSGDMGSDGNNQTMPSSRLVFVPRSGR
jgi:2,4-dienoyl-CoA reductase-like NADH-dependent reductase (Old Yellow Enzyme family)